MANDFKNIDGLPVKYAKHHQAIFNMVKQFNHPDNCGHIRPRTTCPLTLYHVKGHDIDARNHHVDKLAGDARKAFQEEALLNRG
jgi:hypothetical protein